MLPFLHLGFASGLNLGLFTPAMLSFYPLLLTGRHWDAVARWLERRTRAQTIELTVNDPALLRCARVVRELDRFGKITWRAGPGTGVRVCSIAERAAAGEALRACSSALPWGFAVAWLLRLPGLRAVAGLVVRLVLSGVRASRLGSGAPRDVLEPAPRARRAGRVLLEGWVVVLSVAIASEIVNDNTSVPPVLHVHQPAWAKAVIEYPRLLQGWRMFAPEPARTDSMIYVDATTSEGKHVDPYNAVASRQPFPAGEVVPARMDQSQFFVMYSDRIGNSGYAAYRQAFLEWLLAYPQRSGSVADCLIAFDVYLVTDQSPLPGTHASATRVSRDKFMEYKAPASGDCHPVRANARPALAQRDLRR
jgi:hypothetical protein